MSEEKETILEVNDLSVTFTQYEAGFRQTQLPVIRHLDVTVRSGEILAVVGSSGSGKSLLAHAVLGVLPYNASMDGEISYRGEPLTDERRRQLRGREIVLVPQSVSYLDPLMKVGPQIRKNRRGKGLLEKCRGILGRYGLDERVEGLYPFELSGGMARRVLISTAVMEEPRLVIADEPTPGLHMDAARQVVSHFREMADAGAGVLFITHDLELAAATADRIVVFYAGCAVEDAAAGDFDEEEKLRHPYTRALYRAMPSHGFAPSAGAQPYVKDLPPGCPYAPRCLLADDGCGVQPSMRELRGGRVRCVHAGRR